MFFDQMVEDPVLALFDVSTEVFPSPKRSCHRHAFGVHRMDNIPRTTVSPESMVIVNTTDDIEAENVCPTKVVVHRGKRPRKVREVTKGPYVSKKKELAMDSTDIASVLRPCCNKNCYLRFFYNDVKEERHQYWQLSAPQQQDWLCRELAFNGHPNTELGTFKFKYLVNEKECCASFYERALPVSHGRLSTVRSRVLTKSLENVSFSSPPGSRSSPMTDSCENFIRHYAALESGQMPDSVNCQLSEGVTKEDVYTCYLASHDDYDGQTAALSTFYDAWSSRCPCVTTNKWKKFSKCSVCSNLKSLKGFSNAVERGKH